jgi:cation transport ATPase
MKMFKKFSAFLFVFILFAFHSVSAGEKQTLLIQGMMCSTCSGKVQKAFQSTGKMESIKIDVKSGTAEVVWKEGQKPSAEEIVEIVKAAGFSLKSAT